jgi:hypothetical protein
MKITAGKINSEKDFYHSVRTPLKVQQDYILNNNYVTFFFFFNL